MQSNYANSTTMKANFESLYEHVGYLFYAVASEQRNLSTYDLARLKGEIIEALLPLTNIEPTLHYTLLKHVNNAIEQSCNESLTGNNAFEMFEDYYFVHRANFSPTFENKILVAASAISHEFFSLIKDQRGSGMVMELKNLFQPRTAAGSVVPGVDEYESAP